MGVFAVGDEVRVFDVNGPRVGMPEGGYVGKVVKVGRKLGAVVYGPGRRLEFRLDTGVANDRMQHQTVRTVADAERRFAAANLREELASRGVNLHYGRDWDLELLRRLLAAFDE